MSVATDSQVHSSDTSSDEKASHKPLFLCPLPRIMKGYSGFFIYPVNSSPEYVVSTTRSDTQYEDHSVLPLFWCNNKEFDINGGCGICRYSNFGTDYYFCVECDKIFHKECIQSPSKIKQPYHPEHSLQLSYFRFRDFGKQSGCLCCGRETMNLVYYCTKCKAKMHTVCAMKPIPFLVEQPKIHDHPLTLFPRQASLTCNVCGLLRKLSLTYVCLECNFVAHNDCMNSPNVIKISRHHHRISYTSSIQLEECFCGVCRKSIDCDYGAYTCNKCSDYAVHSRCALAKHVWDGRDLEGVLEKDDTTKDVESFERISEGVILHFLHDHNLQLQVSIFYDENKLCQACVLPIFKSSYYSCMECAFVLHETCAKAHRIIQHALHPHPLALKTDSGYSQGYFFCSACNRCTGGFIYQCPIRECEFDIDIRCASISEPFDYKGHEHPLFLALDPREKLECLICKKRYAVYDEYELRFMNCINCGFIVCMDCTTLPYEARYKYEKHFLKILYGEKLYEKDWWCEVCEHNLKDTHTNVLYWCSDCCTTVHIECLLGKDPYVKPGQFFEVNGKEVEVLCKTYASRPLCGNCKNPCQGKILKRDNLIACSRRCGSKIF
ncbi:PREDICTED: uncharacterized protein LOC104786510 [Camelina sativa]|uniref:Uncharacterized protein LOC104786510 n=1 Tax=Camelina sativa TaxID=90675 RepID=A0ABM0Z4B2_CAMSA|nr:PREDICTED: uncharacterized protein LOC104786510 [Camelina sativa]